MLVMLISAFWQINDTCATITFVDLHFSLFSPVRIKLLFSDRKTDDLMIPYYSLEINTLSWLCMSRGHILTLISSTIGGQCSHSDYRHLFKVKFPKHLYLSASLSAEADCDSAGEWLSSLVLWFRQTEVTLMLHL